MVSPQVPAAAEVRIIQQYHLNDLADTLPSAGKLLARGKNIPEKLHPVCALEAMKASAGLPTQTTIEEDPAQRGKRYSFVKKGLEAVVEIVNRAIQGFISLARAA